MLNKKSDGCVTQFPGRQGTGVHKHMQSSKKRKDRGILYFWKKQRVLMCISTAFIAIFLV